MNRCFPSICCLLILKTKMSIKTSVVVAFLLLTLVKFLSANPAYMYWDDYQADAGRKPQQAISLSNCKYSDFCERCAKFTRNEVVYPMCCENYKNVYKYCKDLLEYRLEK